MRLGEKQEFFMRLLPRLIDKAHELGFEIRGGDLFRDPRLHGHVGHNTVAYYATSVYSALKTLFREVGYKGYGYSKSCHKYKLAIDLNLTKGGVLVTTTEGHRELGEWWEAQHELCCWGGRFNDGNHYSLSHNGSK